MTRTIFDSPVIAPLMRAISHRLLRAAGWTLDGALPPRASRCVVIAAPHTSNWDFPLMMLCAFALGMRVRWLGKATLFRFPFGGLMRWLGGIAVHRERANNLVAASVLALQEAEGPLQLVIAPEGTRARAAQWKAGFHHIARGAGMPIQLSYLDWGTRRCGLGPLVDAGEDTAGEIERIRAFYAPMRGRVAGGFDAG